MLHRIFDRRVVTVVVLLGLVLWIVAACAEEEPTATPPLLGQEPVEEPAEEPAEEPTREATEQPTQEPAEETDPTATSSPAPTPMTEEALISTGSALFINYCSTCHQPDGEGVEGAYPALAGNPAVTAEDPEFVIRRVVFGWGGMPGFQNDLTEGEIAAVVSYVRNGWANEASTVTREQIIEIREAVGSRREPTDKEPTGMEGGEGVSGQSDEALAQDLWDTLQEAGYAEAWSLIPGKGELYPGQDPHGALLTTYLNSEAEGALQERPGEMPRGAVIVKENYTPNEDLASVTVMHKQAGGYAPDTNDWFWAKYGPEGEVQAAGMPGGCISCHGAVRSNDYIFSFPVTSFSPGEGAAEEPEATPTPAPEATPTEETEPTPTGEAEDVMTVEVIARNYEFDPATIEVPRGVPVRFVVESVDVYHTFTVKESEGADEMLINLEAYPDEGPVETTYTFEESGEYYLYCIPHVAQGMVGSIVVQEE